MSEVTPRDREEKLLAAIAEGATGELPTPRNRKEKLLKEIYDNGGGGGGGTSVTVDSELSTTSKNPVQNKVITQELNEKGTYSKPTGGIPKIDLASEVQASLENADNVSTLATEVDEIDNGLNSLFRYYEGVDLTQKFTSEIANYSDEWAWIKARIQAGNFKGIYVNDYIPITCSNGYVLKAQIAGINTYTGYADQQVGNHIDFICKELWNDLHVMNKVNYNNGNANSPNPFLASDLNYWLNSMSGTVPNSTSDPSVTTEVDYTAGGVLYYLPDKLKNQIITKRILLPSRYTAGSVLTSDNSWAWQITDKLWIPSEVEVYGAPCWGDSGYGAGGFVQYPYFANNMNRVKRRCSSNDRYSWWLLSARSGNSTHFAGVANYGSANSISATNAGIAAPVCFRI